MHLYLAKTNGEFAVTQCNVEACIVMEVRPQVPQPITNCLVVPRPPPSFALLLLAGMCSKQMILVKHGPLPHYVHLAAT